MQFLGTPAQLARFLAAATTVVLIGVAGVSLYDRNIPMAVASAIVAGWSLSMFFEVLKYEIKHEAHKPQARVEPDELYESGSNR